MLNKSNIEEGIKDLNVEIMFCAAPKALIKLLPNKKDNYFYSIFCFYVEETRQYIVFIKIFRQLKRKQKDNKLFELYTSENRMFNRKEYAYTFLNTFLDMFEEHDRFINEEILEENALNALEAISYINEWQKSVVDFFNEKVRISKIAKK